MLVSFIKLLPLNVLCASLVPGATALLPAEFIDGSTDFIFHRSKDAFCSDGDPLLFVSEDSNWVLLSSGI